ncbi:MAG: ATP-binding protein [Hyphomonadaceae bacterium]
MNVLGPPADIQGRRAGRAVAIGIAVALLGALFGLVYGVFLGPVRGPESWLISSCVIVSSVLLVLLMRFPERATSQVSSLASLYFVIYLCACVTLALSESSELLRCLPYLLWFFPLLAFNRFTNFGRHGNVVHYLIATAPALVLLAFSGVILGSFTSTAIGIVVVYLMSFLSYSVLLNLLSRYRDTYAAGIARAQEEARSSAELRESEARFRRMFDEAGTGMGALDSEGRIQWANSAFLRCVGESASAPNVSFISLLNLEDRPAWRDALALARRGDRRAVLVEGRLVSNAGPDIPFEGSLVRTSAHGALSEAVFFVCQDVSEKRDLKARLRQSQRLEAIGQLTGGVAHDFNNLLMVILGNSEALAENLAGNTRLLGLAELTMKAAERGAELTSRLLAFSRSQTLDPRSTDVNRLVADMDQLLRRTLGGEVDIEFVQAAGLWTAMVDPGQIENAILNLCINARDAMAGGGKLTIETANSWLDDSYAKEQAEVVPGQYVMIAVSDTGIGMTNEVVARAFEPFFTTKDVGKGSGLGLSMVYGFAKQSDGHVKIYSEVGRGTTVKLYLPRSSEGSAVIVRPSNEVAAPTGKEKILLVEDDDLVRDHVSTLLNMLGYKVVAVRNGVAAIDALTRIADFDLLFTDVVMPGGVNGPELADAARGIRPELPVLFTSGYPENAIAHHGWLNRGVQLLRKPYRKLDLATKVRAILDTRAVSAVAAEVRPL